MPLAVRSADEERVGSDYEPTGPNAQQGRGYLFEISLIAGFENTESYSKALRKRAYLARDGLTDERLVGLTSSAKWVAAVPPRGEFQTVSALARCLGS